MKKTLTLLLLLTAVATHGQVKRIQLALTGNYPIIPSVETGNAVLQTPVLSSGYSSTVFTGSVKETFEGAAGMNFNGNIDYALSPRFFISSGLGVSYIRYKRSIEVGLPYQEFQAPTSFGDIRVGQPFGEVQPLDGAEPTVITSTRSGQTSVLYLQVPVLAGFSFFDNKLLVRGGPAISWSLASSVYKPHYTPDKGIEEIKDNSSDSFSSVLVSANVSVSYAVLKKFAIDASAQQYLTPIYKSEFRSGGNARYTVIGLGISYVITK